METTHTTRVVAALCVAVAIVAFIGGYLLGDYRAVSDTSEATPTPTPTVSVYGTPTATPTTAYVPVVHTVRFTASGLSPAALTIRVGDTVTLRNDSSVPFWPASNPHPTHTACPGFDALRGLGSGESYSLTFSSVQTCGYHNHLDPLNAAMQGTITVR